MNIYEYISNWEAAGQSNSITMTVSKNMAKEVVNNLIDLYDFKLDFKSDSITVITITKK